MPHLIVQQIVQQVNNIHHSTALKVAQNVPFLCHRVVRRSLLKLQETEWTKTATNTNEA